MMHSCLNRVQAVFGLFTTVALCVAGLASLSVLLYPANDATASIEMKNVQVVKGRPHYYSTKKDEYAQIRFDLDADLSPLFNWNTKQLFVYVFASYSSSSDEKANAVTPVTESIIWDTIITAPESPYSFNALRERFFSSSKSASAKKRASKEKQKNKNNKNKNNKGSKKDANADTATRPGVLRLRNQRQKYQINDITGKMAERQNVTLSVGWNVQPWVGALWWAPGTGAVPHTGGEAQMSKAFDLPALKGSKPAAGAASGSGSGSDENARG